MQTRRSLGQLKASIMEQLNMTAITALNSSITEGSANPASTHHTVLWITLIVSLLVLLACIPGALQGVGFAATGVLEGSLFVLRYSSIAIAYGMGVVAGFLFGILHGIAMGGIRRTFALLNLIIGLAVVAAFDFIFARRNAMVAWLEAGFDHAFEFAVQVWKQGSPLDGGGKAR